MEEVKFIFDAQLVAAIETLIKDAKKSLLLVSPFIDLDRRIQDALKEKLTKHDFKLQVLFGKNEDNIYKSIKRDSLEFFKQFPNVEIRYSDRLHAKYYQSDTDYIMTSMNLYDYSLANNIEVGVHCKYASRGLLGKMVEGTGNVINQGVDKLTVDVLGTKKDIDPIEKFETIFKESELKYKTKPKLIEKSGIAGFIGGVKLDGFEVEVDLLSKDKKEIQAVQAIKVEPPVQAPITSNNSASKGSTKLQSASQLSKSLKVSQADITATMQAAGYINGNTITALGLSKGLLMKNYMGNDYIAYPEGLEELKRLPR